MWLSPTCNVLFLMMFNRLLTLGGGDDELDRPRGLVSLESYNIKDLSDEL